ncbi:MAG: hypothetical protein LLF89_06510 [Spirochaetaceae bacterium]|nr:hypothetical protein [Spirochaetaceae bacterium]
MKKVWSTLLIVGITVMLLFSSCSLLMRLIAGEWTMYFTWSGSSESSTVWTLNADGTFEDSYTLAGTWESSWNSFKLVYDTYEATYIGTVTANNTYMSGTMSNNLSQSGTWYAERTGIVTSLVPNAIEGLSPVRAPSK